jgi:hypothetical protein
MSNPTIEQLLADARGAMSPSESDRERIYRSVIAASSGPAISAASSASTLLKVVLPIIVLASAGALLLWKMPESVLDAECRKLPAQIVPASVIPETHDSVASVASLIVMEPQVAAVSEKPLRLPARTAADEDDSIIGELKLIQQATAALNRRAPQEATVALDEHRRRFPSGVMAQERDGLRIVALCQRNETEKARKAHEKFQKRSPDAPVHVRITGECGF